MTPLRQRLIEDMQLRGLAPTTQRSYIHNVAEFAKFYNTSPEHLDLEAVRQAELYLLHDRKRSPQSINSFVSALQFLYLVTLEMPWGKERFPRVSVASKRPVVLSPEELERFFANVGCLKRRASDIDSKRILIRVEEGKGRKDRYVMLSTRLLTILRACYRVRPAAQRRRVDFPECLTFVAPKLDLGDRVTPRIRAIEVNPDPTV